MASHSRQKSNSSDSSFRVVKGGVTRRTGSASPTPKTSAGGRLEARTVGSLRRDYERQESRSQRAKRSRERQERHKKQNRKNRRPFIIAGVFVGLVISFIVMYFILANTNIFEIEEVEFTGAEHLTTQEAQALVTIPRGTTLLNVDTAAIATSLERDAWVKSVDVIKKFPHKLEIAVHERKVGAVVEVTVGQNQTIQNWAIADDGMWLMVIPSRDSEVGRQLAEQIYTDAENALHIVGVPYGVSPEIGSYCTDANVNNALQIISSLTTELAGQLKFVNAEEAESILLTLNNNVEIAFGTPDNIREKERICLKIMEDNPTVVYINVRVPDRPTWRST